MAQPTVLQDSFTRMIQDAPRDELPPDALWYMADYVPNLGASYSGRLVKRGGWSYSSEDISTNLTSATKATSMGYFSSQNVFCINTDNNKFGYMIIPGNGPTNTIVSVSSSSIQVAQGQPLIEFAGKIILPGSTPKYWDGTTFGSLAGSPPAGSYATAWKNRLIIGGTSANPRRTYFSAVGDPTTWDTTNSWVDTLANVTGYAVLPNCLLVFGDKQVARIRGSVPPPGSPDMAVDDPIFQTGCGANYTGSIAVNGPNCAFANEQGVFMTNGTSMPQDITAICGIKSYWQTTMRRAVGFTTPNSLFGEFIGQYYIVVVRYNSVASGKAFVFDLVNQAAFPISNFYADSSAMSPQIGDEMYVGIGKRVVSLTSMFQPAAANKADADGTAIVPTMQTRFFGDDKSHRKRWRYAYLDYLLSDAASDNPTLAVGYITEPQGTSYTSIGTLSETTSGETIRAKLPIRTGKRGVALQITQSGNSSMTVIDSLLADVHSREGGRIDR